MTRHTLGIALGGGAARGWAHIGVINALTELGVRPDVVAGTSAGALVGGAYASGELKAFTDWITSLSRLDVVRMLDVTLRGGGFLEGSRVMGTFADKVRNVQLQDLEPPLTCVATDLRSGRETWLREGSLVDAVRASISMPGVFAPVSLNGHWLVDGGLVNPVPVSACRAMGADIVIAVNLNSDSLYRGWSPGEGSGDGPGLPAGSGRRDEPEGVSVEEKAAQGGIGWNLRNLISFSREGDRRRPGLFDVLSASLNIMQDRITRSRMAGDPPDLVLTPRLRGIGLMEFHRADEGIHEGRRAVQRMLPALEHILDTRLQED